MNTQFVEEEVIVDVKFMNVGAPGMILIDSGAPKYVVSKEWKDGYLKDVNVSEGDIPEEKLLKTLQNGQDNLFE